MGIILNDLTVLKNDLEVKNMYFGLAGSMELKYNLNEQKYELRATFAQWASKEARTKRLSPIGLKKIILQYDEPPMGNVYELVYNELKKELSNYNNEI